MTSIKAVLRKTKLSNHKFPIALRVTKNRRSKYFKTPFNTTEIKWSANIGEFNKKSNDYIQKNRLLNIFKNRAYKIIMDLEAENENYTLEDFEKCFRINSNPIDQKIFVFGEDIIFEMKKSGRIGNARVYRETLNSLLRFQRNRHLTFKEIDYTYLEKYENYLRERDGTDGGIGVRMRCIRALFNFAIKRNVIDEKNYPFKVYKVSKLKSRGVKKALTLEEINRIVALDLTEYPKLINFKNYFLFSFYTRGMNFADMVNLQWDNILDEKIYYKRSKTKVNFQIKLIQPVKEILSYYREYPSRTDFIFPILLKKNLTASQIENRKHKVLKQFNSALTEIGNLANIQKSITSYVARHSFATCLKQKGISTDIISESLGHQNLAITQAYLKDFENSVLDEATEVLLC
jgi:site-specific recombinase XerD